MINGQKKIKQLACLSLLLFQLIGCGESGSDQEEIPWWKLQTAGVVISEKKYYAKDCSIVLIDGIKTEDNITEIFNPPSSFGTSCRSSKLYLDEEGYFVFSTCRIAFGAAGGCNDDRYRSKDLENWQEYFGITWRNHEQYEAWIVLGSKSRKADFIKKVEE